MSHFGGAHRVPFVMDENNGKRDLARSQRAGEMVAGEPGAAAHPGLVLLDANGVAKALAVSPWTIYRKAAAGEIPSIRVGRAVRFELGAVVGALRCGESRPASSRESPAAAPPQPRRRHRRKSATDTSLASGTAAPVHPAERLRAAVAATAHLRT